MKFAIQTIFQFSSVRYIHIAVPQISRTFSSCLLRYVFFAYLFIYFLPCCLSPSYRMLLVRLIVQETGSSGQAVLSPRLLDSASYCSCLTVFTSSLAGSQVGI